MENLKSFKGVKAIAFVGAKIECEDSDGVVLEVPVQPGAFDLSPFHPLTAYKRFTLHNILVTNRGEGRLGQGKFPDHFQTAADPEYITDSTYREERRMAVQIRRLFQQEAERDRRAKEAAKSAKPKELSEPLKVVEQEDAKLEKEKERAPKYPPQEPVEDVVEPVAKDGGKVA